MAKALKTNIKSNLRAEKELDRILRQFTITKKIAKHGSQAIIVIPRILQEHLKPETIVQLKIDVLKEAGK